MPIVWESRRSIPSFNAQIDLFIWLTTSPLGEGFVWLTDSIKRVESQSPWENDSPANEPLPSFNLSDGELLEIPGEEPVIKLDFNPGTQVSANVITAYHAYARQLAIRISEQIIGIREVGILVSFIDGPHYKLSVPPVHSVQF